MDFHHEQIELKNKIDELKEQLKEEWNLPPESRMTPKNQEQTDDSGWTLLLAFALLALVIKSPWEIVVSTHRPVSFIDWSTPFL